MIVLAIFTWLVGLALSVDWFLGIRKVDSLSCSDPGLQVYPTLSVVIPALNEAYAVEQSLTSVLTQDYPELEVLVLNDRSTDATGDILERMKQTYPLLRVVHIEELPSGWLGKNHALHSGAQKTRGEWLLFTDADVHFEAHTLCAALAYAVRHDLDHLTAVPQLVARNPLLKAFVSVFMLLFSFGVLRASAPATKAHVGLGAFNLLRRSVYEKLKGHQPIALRPDDDMMLGKLVKQAGYKQVTVFATELLRVEWYTGVREAIRGLHKNAFAGLAYSLPFVMVTVLLLIATQIVPFAAVLLSTGLLQVIYLLVLINIGFVYLASTKFTKLPAWYALLHPVGVAILVYAIVVSAVKATWQGGISWRGTFYSLEQLKKNKV